VFGSIYSVPMEKMVASLVSASAAEADAGLLEAGS